MMGPSLLSCQTGVMAEKNTRERKAVLSMPLDNSKISSTSCESRSVVIYLDTDKASRISQDEGVAVYLPFLNSALDISLLSTHLLQLSIWQWRINQLPAPSSRTPSHRSSTMRSDRSLSGAARFLHTGLDIQVMLYSWAPCSHYQFFPHLHHCSRL